MVDLVLLFRIDMWGFWQTNLIQCILIMTKLNTNGCNRMMWFYQLVDEILRCFQ